MDRPCKIYFGRTSVSFPDLRETRGQGILVINEFMAWEGGGGRKVHYN